MNPRPLITIMPHLPSIRTSGQAIRLLPTPHPSLALVRVLIYVMLQDPRGYHHHVNPSIWAHCHRPENYPTSGFPPKTLFPNTHTCTHAQSCLTLCNPMDCSPSGSSIRGISQARILEWGAISYSRKSSQPRVQTYVFFVSSIGRQILYFWVTCHPRSRSVPMSQDITSRKNFRLSGNPEK